MIAKVFRSSGTCLTNLFRGRLTATGEARDL